MVDVTLIRSLNKGQGHSFWCHQVLMEHIDVTAGVSWMHTAQYAILQQLLIGRVRSAILATAWLILVCSLAC